MDFVSTYNNEGFILAEKIVNAQLLTEVETVALRKVADYFKEIDSLNNHEWLQYSCAQPECIGRIYDEMRDHQCLVELGASPELVQVVGKLVRQPQLYKKIPFRIDVPFETKELAFWHQDDFYVKGNDEEVVVWIPLFDTRVQHGALKVMPGSHKLGKVPHTLVVGKKSMPEGVYSNEIRYVEMDRGDALVFSPLLLHSSSLNISDQIRYSIQLRYTTALKKASTLMAGTIYV